MKNNISKLFYKDYYKGVNFDYVFDRDKEGSFDGQVNENIKKSELELIDNPMSDNENYRCFSAKILYPGLITGIGLVHDSKKLDGAFNLGMHFDYTTGMPIVYGSSVKGVLREYFSEFYEGDMDVVDLYKDIFEGKVRDIAKDTVDDDGQEKRGYKDKSIYQRDIFFDAVIIEVYNEQILEDDAITPHGDDPLKNPIPIAMLKIAPGCKMEFRFLLRDSCINGKIFEKDEKLELFKTILGTVGVGAKTNVGYGQLEVL